MALVKAVSGSKPPQFAASHSFNSRKIRNLRYDFDKWGCCFSLLAAHIATTTLENDKNPNVPFVTLHQTDSKGFHKDLNLLPKPLTAVDLTSSPRDGSKVRVAYQGLPGAYSEDAALKAYPNCETVPCDEFEAAFKAVELWLVEKAVLPIENSVGGSIHRNYDLFLRHRLNIVGEVQLRVNHCLLGLPGVRKEELKCVVSHPQALAQCDMMLNDLGVLKITAHDTAAAAHHNYLSSLNTEPLTAVDLTSSPRDGSKVRVAYQGLPGAYSEDAALKAYPNCETVPCDEFEAAFKAVELWLVEKAVLPIENSVGGSIHRNYDLFLRHRLNIVGEVQLRVNHCLLGLPGVRKEELKCVVSHPQALAQCDMMLNDLGVLKITAHDTAAAAHSVALNCVRDTGAIASSRAANIYGLNVLAERIQDDDENVTRFLILAREPIIPGTDRPYKTSIVFSLDEGPGVLFKALAVFALRDINLSKIESRPLKQRPFRVVDDSNEGSARYFDYLFYIDFEASMADPRAQYALGHLQWHLNLAGSY
ncbi:hypothetical protein TanjilG_26405 [Lupinus angustifolius]|uniref:Arogenate dehydratase n=1 Tax=Lupinus angustifolius TaxID=3871 RepID=A0A4P1R2R4_LUPAN|nr:hypothetical protein TanjilG_26405 [Lupinus angustifolius]